MGRIKSHFYDTVYNLSIIYGFLVNEVADASHYAYQGLASSASFTVMEIQLQ